MMRPEMTTAAGIRANMPCKGSRQQLLLMLEEEEEEEEEE
jgi:hypothetical protein